MQNKERVPRTLAVGDSCNPEVHFPKCNPKSGKPNIPASNGPKVYFEAAVLHELVHAYAIMMGKEVSEEDTRKISDAFNACIQKCIGQ